MKIKVMYRCETLRATECSQMFIQTWRGAAIEPLYFGLSLCGNLLCILWHFSLTVTGVVSLWVCSLWSLGEQLCVLLTVCSPPPPAVGSSLGWIWGGACGSFSVWASSAACWILPACPPRWMTTIPSCSCVCWRCGLAAFWLLGRARWLVGDVAASAVPAVLSFCLCFHCLNLRCRPPGTGKSGREGHPQWPCWESWRCCWCCQCREGLSERQGWEHRGCRRYLLTPGTRTMQHHSLLSLQERTAESGQWTTTNNITGHRHKGTLQIKSTDQCV